MKKALNKMKWIFLIVILFSVPVVLQAQPPFDDDVEDNPVPFDGGVSLLVAAGVGYGLKKAHDRKKAQKAERQDNK